MGAKRIGWRVGKRAFTLVELLVVISIIALLITILLPSLQKAREQAKIVRCAANLNSIGRGFSAYQAEWNGQFPPYNERADFYRADGDNGVDNVGRWWPEIMGEHTGFRRVDPNDRVRFGLLGEGGSGRDVVAATIYRCPSDDEDGTNGPDEWEQVEQVAGGGFQDITIKPAQWIETVSYAQSLCWTFFRIPIDAVPSPASWVDGIEVLTGRPFYYVQKQLFQPHPAQLDWHLRPWHSPQPLPVPASGKPLQTAWKSGKEGGCNFLYMDGHVDYMPLPRKYSSQDLGSARWQWYQSSVVEVYRRYWTHIQFAEADAINKADRSETYSRDIFSKFEPFVVRWWEGYTPGDLLNL